MPSPEDYEKALLKIEELHPAPQVLAKANELVEDPDIEVTDLVNLIKTDEALTTDIIRLSNNAFYGFEVESTNLTQSINRVGFRGVLKLINLSISKSLMANDLKAYGIPATAHWADSASVALMMEALTNRIGENPYDGYTIGLLHSVGRTVINQLLTQAEPDTRWDGTKSYVEWEKEQVGFSYAYAGSFLMKRWGFPKEICQAILYQIKDPNRDYTPIQRCLHFAIEYVDKTGPGFSNLHWEAWENEEILDTHHLGEEDIEEISLEAKEHFLEMKSALGMK